MGLMLGEFVDDFTVKVVDVFAMPQVRRRKGQRVLSLSLWVLRRETVHSLPRARHATPAWRAVAARRCV